jgi:hypothetical protein
VEAVVDDRGGARDRGAHEDRQPADVEEREDAQPPVVRAERQVGLRRGRARGVVAVGEDDRLGARGAPAREEEGERGIRVELVAERDVRLDAAGRVLDEEPG